MGGKTPDAPDPMQTAAAQQSVSMGSAVANKLLGQTNQVTPTGSLSYNQTGTTQWTDPLSGKTFDIPQYTATQTLSPEQQKLYNTQTGAQQNLAQVAKQQSNRIGNLLNKPMDISGAPEVSAPDTTRVGTGPELKKQFGDGGKITKTYGTDFSADRQKVEDALMSRLNPSLQQDQASLEAQLAGKGIKLGSAAYDRAMGNFGQQSNDARMQAILAGGQEQSRMVGLEADRAQFENSAQQQKWGQNLGAATFANQGKQAQYNNRVGAAQFNNNVGQQEFGNQTALRNQYLQEQYAARAAPINEIGALLGTGQVTQPNFVTTPQVSMPTTDYAGIVQQGYQNQLAASQANNPWQGILGGLTSLGSAGIMASDRRLKTDVLRVGNWKGLPLYLFRYIWGGPMQVGLMAQDVMQTRPDAVHEMGGGYLAVDYGAL